MTSTGPPELIKPHLEEVIEEQEQPLESLPRAKTGSFIVDERQHNDAVDNMRETEKQARHAASMIKQSNEQLIENLLQAMPEEQRQNFLVK